MSVRLTIIEIIAVTICLIFAGCQNNQEILPDAENLEETNTNTEPQGISVGEVGFVCGEIIYVPIYSSIFHYKDLRTYELSATLSIHNVDMENSIRVVKVEYFNTDGELIKNFLLMKLWN